MIYSILIINKAGSLVYQLDFVSGDGQNGQGHPRLTENEYLILAGTFHGVHAIASQLSPAGTPPSSGIQLLETDTFKLNCFQTLTGIKFILTSSPSHPNIDVTLRQIYTLYSDLVMKNPFHTPEMPIRNKLFDEACRKIVGINAV